MSDTTDLYDTCIVLLQHLAWVESSHNIGDTEHVNRLLWAVDPDELRLALRDLRELNIRTKALEALRDVTTGGETAAPDGAPASGEAEVTPPYVPGHLGYSVKVRCQ